MSENERSSKEASEATEAKASPPLLRAEDLFQGQPEIWIEHHGERYRLRITRRNKLILQK